MGAGCRVACPNSHGTVEIVTTKCMAGGATVHELACGCRNTSAEIVAGSSVSGSTLQVGKPIKKSGWNQRDASI